MSADGGECDELAPVIPLFGGAGREGAGREGVDREGAAGRRPRPAGAASPSVPPMDRRGPADPVAPSAPWSGRAQSAPSAPDFGPERSAPDTREADAGTPGWDIGWIDERVDRPALPPTPARGVAFDDGEAEDVWAVAEKTLLRKLRTRSLSEREARAVALAAGLDGADADELVELCRSRGYLDDARLAEQLIHTGSERKGQGRQVIARTLAARGVPREVADAALATLADDDAERALEFARGKARGMRGLERDVALRRLAGQLARRGYGAQALSAARRALDELDAPRGVRFE